MRILFFYIFFNIKSEYTFSRSLFIYLVLLISGFLVSKKVLNRL